MTKIDDALVRRMERLVREWANVSGPIMVADGSSAYLAFKTSAAKRWEEARAIVAEMPAPVDPDLVTARDLAASFANAYHEDAMADEYKNGMYDADPEIVAILAALRRAREEGVK